MAITAPSLIAHVDPAPLVETMAKDARERPQAKAEAPQHPVAELRDLVRQDNLEVRIEELPKGGGTVYRIVDPQSGEVVREFPPEKLIRMLAEIRARATERLDARV
jgi:uncharacterized FlaG/YvyC family protein